MGSLEVLIRKFLAVDRLATSALVMLVSLCPKIHRLRIGIN